ncbi:MAG: urea carboxylase-associated family protein [Desulfobacterales bacterium]|nr:MAG: urea carboxylase-associated family protein [Desulfobacterales bacterium]
MVKLGKLVDEIRIPGGHARAFQIRKSQFVTITDLEGEQVGDFIAFNKSNLDEKLSPTHTRTSLLSVSVSVGDLLRSNYRSPMFEVVDDTVGSHDMLLAMCDEWRYLVDYGVKEHRNCMANFEEALKPYGIARQALPDPFNVFQHTKICSDGSLQQLRGVSKPGDYIRLRSLMDVIGAVSACPMDLNPIGGAKISDLSVKIND